jgi:hypothetical protein
MMENGRVFDEYSDWLKKTETSGPLRVVPFWEGWAVTGEGLLLASRTREDAEQHLALLLDDKAGRGMRITREMVDAGRVTEVSPGKYTAREEDIGMNKRIRRWLGTDLGNGRTFDLIRIDVYTLDYRQNGGSITLTINMTV